MCLDCGCHHPSDTHGDNRHITMQDLQQAAEASNVSVQEVAQRIQQEVQQGSAQRSGSSNQM